MLLTHEPVIRGAVFIVILLAVAVWEIVAERRHQSISRRQRWPANLAIVVLDTMVVRLVFPLAGVGAAFLASERGWGLFNIVETPVWLALVLSVLILDLAIYFQHRLFHAIPWLWRLHRMHHADLEFDVTTGLRFHPLEILISMGIKLIAVMLLGAPAVSVIIFEVILNATSMFNHGNVNLPASVDRWLRFLLVTPDMHRVHHSIVRRETDSNFGFNIPWWDRLFGTYIDQPTGGHLKMVIGIEQFRDSNDLRLGRMLLQPFKNSVRDERQEQR
ncbi:sterol desaturase family protein [Saccharospirillum sp.]|uniref:sterol desaturase family protein n=1 Tax=Saccharospirillum sp. TaxID=2033801 RepID=UPI0034A02B63